MERLAILASGRGTDFQSILDHINLNVLLGIKIVLLICNVPNAYVITRARNAGITTEYIEGIIGKKFVDEKSRKKAREQFDTAVLEKLRQYETTVIALAGFNQIISPIIIDSFMMRIMNIHPAYDTKRYGGVGMIGEKVHAAVLANREQYSGCTVHYVNNTVDLGRIILRQRVPIKNNDTIKSLSDRILVWEHRTYSKAIQIHVDNILESRSRLSEQNLIEDEWEKSWNDRQKNYIIYQNEHSFEIYGKPLDEII